MTDLERLPGEPPQAYKAFQTYRDLPGKRSLRAVCDALALDRRGSGLTLVKDGESAEGAVKKRRKKENGRVSLWSRKFRWVERAARWDAIIDARIRERQLELIEAMAKRHAAEAELVLQNLMTPAITFAKKMLDPARAAVFNDLPMVDLFKLGVCACSFVPRLQAAERLARGCKVIYPGGSASPASPQGPAEWRISIYAPPRKGPTPEDIENTAAMADEWEDAEPEPPAA
jgi:hypothetical protein